MQASSRTVYGRTFAVTPAWVWLLQRASGLALGPLVALHAWVPGLAGNRVLSALLLVIVIAHGYTGVRRMASGSGKATLCTVLALAWCAVVALAGLLVIAAA
jgi:succinate dehydrogenase hydrophobic anchor subunit